MPLAVAKLVKDIGVRLEMSYVVRGTANERMISEPRIQKPGLALTGYRDQLHKNRLLVLGGTEVDYLAGVDAVELERGIGVVMESEPACIVLTRGLEPPVALVEACEAARVPLLVSSLASAAFIIAVTRFLQEVMARTKTIHGVLMDVLGVGVLLLGKSGLGKSECALDLIVRGHRLVADDVVTVRQLGQSVYGFGNDILKHRMEIRGLGVLNIKDLFGISSVRDNKKIEMVAELMHWDDAFGYDRLGVEDSFYEILDVSVPFIQLPVHPGRNIAILIEVSARNQLLKAQGYHSAREFDHELKARMGNPSDLDGLE